MTETKYAAMIGNEVVRLSKNIKRINLKADKYLVIDNCGSRNATFFSIIFQSSNYDEIVKFKEVKGL